MFERTLDLNALLRQKSFFLFGPRATGKSSLIRQQLKGHFPILDLLDNRIYLDLVNQPYRLERYLAGQSEHAIAVIDEVQRIPLLLNEVHRLIEEKKYRFLLTGSSARKLRHGEVNLLAGRAWKAELFPLTSHEIDSIDLARYLRYGGLPPVYTGDMPEEELFAYVNTYLQEEIQAEALVRRIPAFARFLEMAAMTSGEVLNFTNVANDAGLPASTVREYYFLLEDTFLGFMLSAWNKSKKRKAMSTAKFYFFDIGVRNVLAKITSIEPLSDQYGKAFEHFIAMELRAYLSYKRIRKSFNYWRTSHGDYEVDFIIGDEVAIEVKATHKVQDKHLRGLKALIEEKQCKQYYLVTQDIKIQTVGEIQALPWDIFLKRLWAGELFI